MGGPRTTQTQNTNQTQVQNTRQNQEQSERADTQSTVTGTNTFGHMPGASSADIDAARNFQFSRDPRVGFSFARAFERVKDSFANPMGAATTPGIRDAILRTSAEDIGQQSGQAFAEENHALQGRQFGQLMDVARMTAPQFVQTGSTGTSSGSTSSSGSSSADSSGTGTTTGTGTATTQQSLNPLNSIIGGASSIGSALIM